ncbi:MAG: hypothetical protein KF744_08940 [Taibaiella sp.]|nr:hypothetical protein [Taibaiella sp.]
MRGYIAAFAGACLIMACQAPVKIVPVEVPPMHDTVKVMIMDTVYVPDTLCTRRYDSLRNKYYVQAYKMERIRYYVGICNKNRSQDKFLKGWLNRVLDH